MAHLKREEQRDEPVSIGIAIIDVAEALTATAIGYEAAAAIGYVAIGAALVGAQYALSKFAKPSLPDLSSYGGGINAPEIRGNVNQSDPPQRIVYGSPRVGGAFFFFDTDTPPYLYLGLMLSRRPCTVRKVIINNNELVFPTTAANTILTPVNVPGQPYYSNGASRLQACFRDGRPGQAVDALLAANFGSLDSNFKQLGTATATFKFSYGNDLEDFQNMWGHVAIPSPLMDVDGAPVYDPRDATQRYVTDWNDPDDVAAAMATWKFTANAALIQADWLGAPYGLANPIEKIDWDKIATAADFDDEIVVCKDGTPQRRHEIHGVVLLKGQKNDEIMTAMLTANRGFSVTAKGKGWISSSQPQDPVLTIDDSMLLKGFEFRVNRQKRDLVNSTASQFASGDREYQQIQGPSYKRDDLIESDGEELLQSIQLPFEKDYRRAERIQKQFLEESRLERAITIPALSIKALGLAPGQCVRVWSKLFPQMNGTYLADPIGLLDDISAMTTTLNEYDPTICRNWIASTDEQAFTLPDVGVS
jgi:hypothetical protein